MIHEYYAVIVKSFYHVPGDERSKQNPGHGYPARDVEYDEIIEFKNDDEFKDWIVNRSKGKKYRVIRYRNVNIKVTTNIDIDVIDNA